GHMFAAHPDATAAAVGAVLDQVPPTLPVFAKLSPNVTDLVAVAAAALGAGAAGPTLINTVLGLAIDAESPRPRLRAGRGGRSDLARGRRAGPAAGRGALRRGGGAAASPGPSTSATGPPPWPWLAGSPPGRSWSTSASACSPPPRRRRWGSWLLRAGWSPSVS